MWEYNHTDELYHYGRKGMKWGQHIFGKQSSSSGKRKKKSALQNYLTKRKKRKAAEAAAEKARLEAKAYKRKKIKDMSDAELKERIARLELEKRYSDLKSETSKSQTGIGKRFVNKYIDTTVDKIAESAAADVTAQMIKVALVKGANRVIGNEEVFTNNKKK